MSDGCWGYRNGDGLCRGHRRKMAECDKEFGRCPSCGRPLTRSHAEGCVRSIKAKPADGA